MQLHTRSAIALACAAAILSAAPVAARPTSPVEVPRAYAPLLGDCATLDACLKALEPAVPNRGYGGVLPDGDKVRARLLQFGDPAKRRLFQLLAGRHVGWRNLAGYVLKDWPGLTADDVPALLRAQAREPEGWSVSALGLIGTDEAIDALIAHLKERDGPTAYGLVRAGPRVLPRLLPLLEDPARARGVEGVIHDLGESAAVEAPGWRGLAISPETPKPRRLAALKALRALGHYGRPGSEALHALLDDPDPDIARAAFEALREARDPVTLRRPRAGCPPVATRADQFSEAVLCMWYVARFGPEAATAAPAIRLYLTSPHPEERANAIALLGYVGDAQSVPAMRQALSSRDWREVFVAARSLGWLNAQEARGDLAVVARDHWLPEVRREAVAVIAALDAGVPEPRPADLVLAYRGLSGMIPGALDLDRIADETCTAGGWMWQGRRFRVIPLLSGELRIRNGLLIGWDGGEWGGGLTFSSQPGKDIGLARNNVSGIAPAGDGAVVAFGLAHMGLNYGYVVYVGPDAEGNGVEMREIGALPGDSDGIRVLGPDLFATHGQGRMIVFTSSEILGLAECAG